MLFGLNMETFPQRLERLIEELRINQSKFADLIGEPRPTISKYLSESKGYKPGFDNIQKIMKTFPNLNGRWLILGEGEIWTTDYSAELQAQLVENQKKHSELESAKKMIDTQEKLIGFLENEVYFLRNKS